jgi:tetratricopeptide (TPR) repeat protein
MKRKTIFLTCLLIIISGSINLAKADVESRRAELIKVLDEELREVVRLNKQTGGARPALMLRMGQVLLEKARLIKDQENQKYLEIPQEQRSKVSIDEHFKESRKYFDQAQKTVLVLLKKFPRFEDRGDAYYILAYNAKELKQEDESKKFFQKTIDESRSDSVTGEKARIALAEMYFNKGSYDKSMNLYEAALKNKRDKWWTKDAFNLSWCYFKMAKFDKAIDLMNEAYELSKNAKFIDMSKSIERDIAFFYTEAGRSNEAVQFYKKNGKNVSEVLLKVGRFLNKQGKYTAAEKTLTDALQLKQSEKEEVEINVELLSLYEKFGRYDKHLEACKFLAVQFEKGALNPEQIEILKYNVQKVGALLQQQVVAKTFDHQTDVRDKKVAAAVDYFTIDAKLDNKKSAEALFHAGETYFAIGNYDKAVPLYAEAVKVAKTSGDKKTQDLAGNSLMVSLGKGVKKDTAEKFLVPAYEAYLNANPKGEKANLIYQRLFSSLVEQKNIAAAEGVLGNYHLNFPNETGPQEKMIAQVMDHYKSKSDKNGLMAWSKKIDSGEYKVSNEYAKTVKELTLGMQFEKVEEANTKGDKKAALKGYFQIYKANDSTAEAKKMAAYNIAVLFYELGDWKQMYNWADRSVGMMNVQDLQKFEKDLIVFSTDLFQRRQFNESSSLSEKAFDKMCQSDSKNKKVFFKNANIIYLADKQFEKSRTLIQKAINCKVIQGGYLDHLNELAQSNRWSAFTEILGSLDGNKDVHAYLIYPSSLLANEYENIGKVDEAKKTRAKMLSYFESAKKSKIDVPLEGLDAIANIKIQSFEDELTTFKNTKLHFPEKDYNKLLKVKFSKLEKLATEAEAIAEIGSGVGILKVYHFMIEGYDSLREELINFTPPGKSEDYVKSFKKSMNELAAPLAKQAADFRDVALKKIEKDSILSKDNIWFLNNRDSFPIQFFNNDGGVIMDKAGQK